VTGCGDHGGLFDNDGRSILYLSNFGSNQLRSQHGDGTLTRYGRRGRWTIPRLEHGATFADFDPDEVVETSMFLNY